MFSKGRERIEKESAGNPFKDTVNVKEEQMLQGTDKKTSLGKCSG